MGLHLKPSVDIGRIGTAKLSREIPDDNDDGRNIYWRQAYCIGYTAICSKKSIKNGFPIRKGKKSSSHLFDCDEKEAVMMIDDDD